MLYLKLIVDISRFTRAQMVLTLNKKVLLRDCKRSITCSVACLLGGTPYSVKGVLPSCPGDTPCPIGGGTLSCLGIPLSFPGVPPQVQTSLRYSLPTGLVGYPLSKGPETGDTPPKRTRDQRYPL